MSPDRNNEGRWLVLPPTQRTMLTDKELMFLRRLLKQAGEVAYSHAMLSDNNEHRERAEWITKLKRKLEQMVRETVP